MLAKKFQQRLTPLILPSSSRPRCQSLSRSPRTPFSPVSLSSSCDLSNPVDSLVGFDGQDDMCLIYESMMRNWVGVDVNYNGLRHLYDHLLVVCDYQCCDDIMQSADLALMDCLEDLDVPEDDIDNIISRVHTIEYTPHDKSTDDHAIVRCYSIDTYGVYPLHGEKCK